MSTTNFEIPSADYVLFLVTPKSLSKSSALFTLLDFARLQKELRSKKDTRYTRISQLIDQHLAYLSPFLGPYVEEVQHWPVLYKQIASGCPEKMSHELSWLLVRMHYWQRFVMANLWFAPYAEPAEGKKPNILYTLLKAKLEPWYVNNTSPVALLKYFYTNTSKLILSIPTQSFNNNFPKLECPPTLFDKNEYQSKLCDICGDSQFLFYECPQCKDKNICYNCVRQQFWAASHSDNEIFTEHRPVHCSFCRHLIDSSRIPIDVHAIKNNGKKRLFSDDINDNLIFESPPKRQVILAETDL